MTMVPQVCMTMVPIQFNPIMEHRSMYKTIYRHHVQQKNDEL
jgi:hypothetical protein